MLSDCQLDGSVIAGASTTLRYIREFLKISEIYAPVTYIYAYFMDNYKFYP